MAYNMYGFKNIDFYHHGAMSDWGIGPDIGKVQVVEVGEFF